MSIDVSVVCDKHRVYRHMGQDMGSIFSLGYGSKDVEGARQVGDFIINHLYCNLRLVSTDDLPGDEEGYVDDERMTNRSS